MRYHKISNVFVSIDKDVYYVVISVAKIRRGIVQNLKIFNLH